MSGPLVSVLMPTKNRPEWLPFALRCYAEQDYPDRELLVLDDGAGHPVDEAAVAAVGGRVVRFGMSLALGAKLDAGVAEARGAILAKMDDDDWFAPGYLRAHVEALVALPAGVATPVVVGCSRYPHLFIRRWESFELRHPYVSGNFCFSRALHTQVPFPHIIGQGTDTAFFRAAIAAGHELVQIDGRGLLVMLRRDGLPGASPHTFLQDRNQPVEQAITARKRPLATPPETLLPAWAVAYLAAMRDPLASDTSAGSSAR